MGGGRFVSPADVFVVCLIVCLFVCLFACSFLVFWFTDQVYFMVIIRKATKYSHQTLQHPIPFKPADKSNFDHLLFLVYQNCAPIKTLMTSHYADMLTARIINFRLLVEMRSHIRQGGASVV